jgi:hypothetical protein
MGLETEPMQGRYTVNSGLPPSLNLQDLRVSNFHPIEGGTDGDD